MNREKLEALLETPPEPWDDPDTPEMLMVWADSPVILTLRIEQRCGRKIFQHESAAADIGDHEAMPWLHHRDMATQWLNYGRELLACLED